jgi:hypothetical protein
MPYAAPITILADFQQELVGTWHNHDIGNDEHGHAVGGEDNPLSYNIMPLPDVSDPDGYILKNFKYHERIRFNNDHADDTLAIAAEAPNRGGHVAQNSRALFYEQQVKFAEGPARNSVVHVENGAWLWLPRVVQQEGAYPHDIDAEPVSDALQQPASLSIAKQIAVPHGNSILALGYFDTVARSGHEGSGERSAKIDGRPVICDAPFPFPLPAEPEPNAPSPPSLRTKLNVDLRYATREDSPGNYQNPHPVLSKWINKPLQQAVDIIDPDAYMHWHVTTEPLLSSHGYVTNIPFEESVSKVTAYWADYWLLYKSRGHHLHRYLAYTQTILMNMKVKDEYYLFPHVTCNVLTYKN